jgi:FdrA protein
MCLLDAAGVGVAAALGVGGRDLSAEVGGPATRAALARLDADPAVEHVVVVSKPPAADVAAGLEEYAATLGTPVTFALLGPGRADLTSAAEELLGRLDVPVPAWPTWGAPAGGRPGLLRGLFAGGTLCDEAMLIATAALGPVRSNIPLSPELALGRDLVADTHLMVDFGDDALTQGRAHPMIDPTLRLEHLARVAADPATGAVLLDVVLGHGSDPDPASSLAPAVAAATATGVPVVVSCIGTEADPQALGRQASALADAGAEVHLSNAAAARRAVSLVGGAA